jgi:hypothetical protein
MQDTPMLARSNKGTGVLHQEVLSWRLVLYASLCGTLVARSIRPRPCTH